MTSNIVYTRPTDITSRPKKLSDELTEITKVLLESNDHSLIPIIYKLSTGNSLISQAKALEAAASLLSIPRIERLTDLEYEAPHLHKYEFAGMAQENEVCECICGDWFHVTPVIEVNQ
jgi:hypothetical protein